MIATLLVDADEAPDFPGNTATALGRPLAAYPMMAARASAHARRHYAVTESVPVKAVAAQNAAVIIDPPKGDQTFETRLVHAYAQIVADLKRDNEKLDLLCVFSSATPTITTALLDEGIEAMMEKHDADSAVSVSKDNRRNPLLARRIGKTGALEAIVRAYSDEPGDVWFPDLGVQILRPTMLDKGTAPSQPLMWWLGARTLPLRQEGGVTVDFQWQVPAAEHWLKRQGFADISASYEPQPKPQPQTQPRDRR